MKVLGKMGKHLETIKLYIIVLKLFSYYFGHIKISQAFHKGLNKKYQNASDPGRARTCNLLESRQELYH